MTKVIEQAKIDHFTRWFERADKIVIVSHVSPDGDAIGSSLGLYHFLDSSAASQSFGYNEDPIVSSDVIGMKYGSLFDSTQTMVAKIDSCV